MLRHEDRPERTKPMLFLPGSVADYKPNLAGGDCYIKPFETGVVLIAQILGSGSFFVTYR